MTPDQRADLFLSTNDRDKFATLGSRAFGFEHRLGDSPLLQLEPLRDLAHYFQKNELPCHFEFGNRSQDSGWGSKPAAATLLDGFDQLQEGCNLVLLKGVHRHPDYARLMSDFLAEVGGLTGSNIAEAYRRPICTIILASPHRVTPYHMDDSHNLLMQIRGSKAFYIFDGTDPDILSDPEQEAFWHGDEKAVRLTEIRQRKAKLHDLGPECGVHVPMTYPHWAKNGEDVSVAVSINFQPADNGRAEIYAVNGFLRSRGLHPKGPGRYRLRDASKIAAYRTLSALKHIARRSTAP